jgi:hypothetical protein
MNRFVPDGILMPLYISSLSAIRSAMGTVVRRCRGRVPGGINRRTSLHTLFKYFKDSRCSKDGVFSRFKDCTSLRKRC